MLRILWRTSLLAAVALASWQANAPHAMAFQDADVVVEGDTTVLPSDGVVTEGVVTEGVVTEGVVTDGVVYGDGAVYPGEGAVYPGAVAVCRPYTYGNPDLFYNFYVAPNCGGMGANLYVAPLPVPPHVGHTYYTYQPFMPHEYLYHHHRTYHRYYDDGRGITRAHVSWSHPHVKTSAKALYQHFRIPR